MIDKAFFKFLAGFVLILVVGLAGMIVFGSYSDSANPATDLIASFFR